MQEELYNKEL